MTLTPQMEADILKAYHVYWDAYLKGDIPTMFSLMDETCTIIGSGNGEVFGNRAEALAYCGATADQIADKAQMRDRKISLVAMGDLIQVIETSDFYVLVDDSWTLYGPVRISTLMGQKGGAWIIFHQHGSLPDTRTGGGEQINTDRIKEENYRLKDAIKRRTLELEQKNRELEIEAALERVRAVAMGMQTPDDLQAVGEVIFTELKTLGFTDLQNTAIIINTEEKETIRSYYYSDSGVSGTIEANYAAHPVLRQWAADMKHAPDGFATIHIPEEEFDAWRRYREEIGYPPDPKLDAATSIDYYSYSIGLGALSVSSFRPITDEQRDTLERFRNVFGLAYRRYVDVAQAEAQAREAQIEAALERVRSRSLAVNRSNEFIDVVGVVFQNLSALNLPVDSVTIALTTNENNDWDVYGCGEGDAGLTVLKFRLPYFSNAFSNDIIAAQNSCNSGYFSKIYSEGEKMNITNMHSKTRN
ncbi:MAG: hypothetical protein D6746_11105 [Bacteroidetes bacterium]|nr:MAG: hypothetical protein D6746_11105 [Bacteroidota bacterium]